MPQAAANTEEQKEDEVPKVTAEIKSDKNLEKVQPETEFMYNKEKDE